jgi:hypothetical protein
VAGWQDARTQSKLQAIYMDKLADCSPLSTAMIRRSR